MEISVYCRKSAGGVPVSYIWGMNEEKNQDPHPHRSAADTSRLTGFFGLLMTIDQRQRGKEKEAKGGSN